MRKIGIAAAVLVFALLVSGAAAACDCSEGSLCSRLSARMIFVARAVKTPEPGIFRLIVEERFAGVPESVPEITAFNDPICDMNTEDGQRYLFFGTTLPNNTTFWIVACSGSELAQRAGDEIAFLREWSRGKLTPSIHGKVTDQNDQPIANATVTLSSDGRQWSVRGNSSGEYVLNDIPPGDFAAVAERVNFGKSQMKTLEPVRVVPGGCGELNIQMSLATRISGHVVDADGKPAALIDVDLVDGSGQSSGQTFVTDLDGAFVFEDFGSGTYYLEVGESSGPTSETPFDHRFYPGVESEEKADKIDVNGPVDLNDLVFRLGKRHLTRKIRIRALWENGQPVMNGLLLCHSGPQFGPGSDRLSVPADLDGTATCDVLADRDYDVKVERLLWTGEFAAARNSETAMVKEGTTEVSVTVHLPLQPPHEAGHAPENGKDLERQPGKR